MPRLRTFIAIDPGKTIRNELLALQDELAPHLRDVKWVEWENLHLTLFFLGEAEERDLFKICRCAEAVTRNHAPFALSFGGLGCFPNPPRPRVFWVGAQEGAGEVIKIHHEMEGPLLDLGCYRREARQFTPHLTLGRAKGEPSPALAKVLSDYQTWKAGDALIKEVLVMCSELTPEGPLYTVMSRAKFAAPQD